MSGSAPRRWYRLFDFPRVVSCISVAAGALVLVGWFFDVTTLKGVLPGWTLIKANTAAAMILCGMALWETQASAQARLGQLVGQVCSGVVLLLGLLTVAEYVSGLDFGIDQLLIREVTSLPGDIPGRMAVNTALALAALAAALLLVLRGTSRFITAIHALLLVPIMAAGSALIGYGYDIEQILREKLDYTPMAFPTAVLIILLALGVASTRPEYPFRRFMVSDSAAGVMVRRLLPAVIVFTLAIGLLIERGYHAGHVGPVFALALFSAASITGLSLLVVWSARTFDRADTLRKQAEDALRESSERIRDLYNNVPNGYLSADANGIVTEMNDTLLHWLQYSREEIIGKPLGKFLTAEGVEAAKTATKILEERGWTRDDAYDLVRRDGSAFPVLASSTPVMGPDGKLLMSRCSVFDNTERRRAEEQLRAASLYARSLLDASLDPLVTISAEGKVTDVNEATIKVTGVRREELIGTDFSNYFTEPDKAREGYQQVFAKGLVTDYPLTIRHKDGRLTDVLYNASVYKDTHGNVLGVFAAARDVTAQKQAAQYARSLIEASPDPLVTISAEGKITDVNEATIRATGASREQLLGSDFSNYFTEPDKARAGYQEVFAKGFVKDYPLALRARSGSVIEVLYNASVYRDAQGEVAGVFAAARDITDLRQTEHALTERVKELRAFYYLSELAARKDFSLESMCQELVNLLPQSWQYPEIACARIIMREREFRTANFSISARMLVAPISALGEVVGKVEVGYLEQKPDEDEGLFLREERQLIDAIAERIGQIVELKRADATLRASEELFRALANATSEGMLIHDHGRIVEANRQMERILGRPRPEIVGVLVLDFVAPAWRDLVERRVEASEDTRVEFAFLRADGSEVLVSGLAHPCVYLGRPMRVAVYRDITLEKRAEEALRNVGTYNRSLIEVSLDPLVTISPAGKITDVNEATIQATGMPRSLLLGSDFSSYFTEPEKARAGYEEVFAKGFVADYPLSLRHVSGRTIDVLYNASVYRNTKGEIAGVFAAARDVTERKKLERELERQAHIDMLTDLNNRRHFMELADRELARSRRHNEPLSLLMMDVDHFKVVNDTYGHDVGDAVLRKLSDIFRHHFRGIDIVGRLGGEEFVAMLPETTLDQALEVAERLRQAVEISDVKLENGALIHFTVSVGVTSFGATDDKIGRTLKRADAALYKAKNTGRNQVCAQAVSENDNE